MLGRLAVLVLDEADLLLSYGHEADLQAIAPQVGTKSRFWDARHASDSEAPQLPPCQVTRVCPDTMLLPLLRPNHRRQLLPCSTSTVWTVSWHIQHAVCAARRCPARASAC